MAEDTESVAEPSMEEILASIRKIISDENVPAPEPAPEAPEAAPQEEVLELTQLVEEDGSVTDVRAEEPAPPPPPPPEPVAPPPPIAAAPPPVSPSEPLVSAPAANSAVSALSSLANTLEIERLAAAPNNATLLGNGGRTLEDMVVELMRPLLKDWLDKNLPAVVERLVQKEIEHIARRL